jgi:hypothetical protein
MAVLRGLAPVSELMNTATGRAALSANFTLTGGIQTGALAQSTLLPFAEQQQQALRDVFITGNNLAELADGLGTTLSAAYAARFHYTDRTTSTDMPKAVANLIAYASAVTEGHSNAGKYFFTNATTDGATPVSADAMAILIGNGGVKDVFGKAYNLPAGSVGADAYGNSRPFQTEKKITQIVGLDYFSTPR